MFLRFIILPKQDYIDVWGIYVGLGRKVPRKNVLEEKT
jgi:hypothetical protein